MKRFCTLIAWCAVALVCGIGGTASAAERVALVIGNSGYLNADELPNPKNDANALGAALEQLGFDVELQVDLDQRSMQQALRDFGLKAEVAEVAVVFYAGHGIQVASENYLLPVDARLERERDLVYEGLPLGVVLAEVAQAERLGLVILDACRDNPLADRLRRALGPIRSRVVGQGLARVENLPGDTMIAFSTKPGEVAVDGEGDLSPFTEALIEHIHEPGVELDLLFRKVRDTVLTKTAYRQEPRSFDALGAEPFYFKEPKPNERPQLAQLAALEVLDDAGPSPLEIAPPSDPDNDPLTVQVTGLPRSGTVKIGERTVLIGDTLTIDQLGDATYSPEKGGLGDLGAFGFVVKDDRGGTTVGRVPIQVARANQPPVLQPQLALVMPPIPLNIQPPQDPDGDPLTIKVTELPERGVIRSGDRALEVGDELTPEALAGLVLDGAADGASGAFGFEVIDSMGASVQASVPTELPAWGVQPEVQIALAEPAKPEPSVSAEPAEAVSEAPVALVEETAEEPVVTARAVAPSGAEPKAPDPQLAAIIGDYVTVRDSNLRLGPSAKTDRVGTVPAGTTLRVTGMAEEGSNWYRVETQDGREGFIYGTLIEPKSEEAEPEPEPEQQVAAAVGRVSADALQDCEMCPELVEIPAGSFEMGSSVGHSSEQPARRVTIASPFALGKYEVTVAEWQACVDSGGCPSGPDLSGKSPQSPIHNVSWTEARDYLTWLGEKTGHRYRLPSEAEWEYAARGDTQTRFWWGDEPESGRANCNDCGGDWDKKSPAEVGSFPPNPFGLHDMNGGVMEWIADCWFGDYQGAPNDGSARIAANCPQRGLRGGSWRNDHSYATATSRLSYDADVRYYTNGFRVARDLN